VIKLIKTVNYIDDRVTSITDKNT